LTAELERRGHTVIRHSEADGDLRDRDSVRRLVTGTAPDHVIHLAGISFVPHSSPSELYEVNTVGTTNLLEELASLARVRKVVLASSSQVYGHSDATGLTEDDPCRPASHYACSKLAMEHMAALYSDRMPLVIVRPFNYTGAGQPEHFLVPKIIAHFARREPAIELGNIDVVRDFSDVRTVVDVYCRLLESGIEGGVFNFCSGVGRSLRWILDETARLSGWTLEVRVRSDLIRRGEAHHITGSNERLVRAIGPLEYQDFSDTLQWMLRAAAPKTQT